MAHWVPEVLAPAGSLQKLKVAVLYGANAVYLGGMKFGLRSAAENFTREELKEGVEFAHSHNSKVYVVLNGFLHDQDLDELPDFIHYLENISVDAVIVSDMGVLKTVDEETGLAIHLSTQASCLNSHSGLLWKRANVTRLILGREVSVEEAGMIRRTTGLEVEMFIHGSMCMAYSGNCVISNYTQGRDSNRGGCAHSCRFEYSLEDQDSDKKVNSFFMSSKDLQGLKALPTFVEQHVDSIKIEGRMKSNLYAGTTSKVYSEILRTYKVKGIFTEEDLLESERELEKIVHRDYTMASLAKKADAESIYGDREHDGALNDYQIAGNVLDVIEGDRVIMRVKNAFTLKDDLELVPFQGKSISLILSELKDMDGELIEKTKPGQLIHLPYIENAKKWNIVRKRQQL